MRFALSSVNAWGDEHADGDFLLDDFYYNLHDLVNEPLNKEWITATMARLNRYAFEFGRNDL